MKPRVVLDTNVLVAGMRSRLGASHRLLQLAGEGRFDLVLSVPLVLEYEDALLRASPDAGLSPQAVRDLLDYLCAVGEHRRIFYLWRPFLRDPKDDMVLELAVESACEAIVTHNLGDFAGVDRFGLSVLRPGEFLRDLEVKP